MCGTVEARTGFARAGGEPAQGKRGRCPMHDKPCFVEAPPLPLETASESTSRQEQADSENILRAPKIVEIPFCRTKSSMNFQDQLPGIETSLSTLRRLPCTTPLLELPPCGASLFFLASAFSSAMSSFVDVSAMLDLREIIVGAIFSVLGGSYCIFRCSEYVVVHIKLL